MDDFKCFAYITKDRDKQNYYCHVFSAFNLVSRPSKPFGCDSAFRSFMFDVSDFGSSKDMANEILLTLGQAFEIAYRLEVGETIDSLRKLYIRSKLTKSGPNVASRLSSNAHTSGPTLSESQFNMAFRAASHTLFRRKDDHRRHSLSSNASAASSHSHSQRTGADGEYSRQKTLSTDLPTVRPVNHPRPATRSSSRDKPTVPIKPPHIHHHHFQSYSPASALSDHSLHRAN
jgi:hypothetical protein